MAENIESKLAKPSPKKELNKAELSEHISRLAQPKRSTFITEEPAPPIVKKSTLKYKATKRIQILAKPKYVIPKKVDQDPIDVLSQSITSVNPKALHYKASRRIQELAQPK